MEEFHADNRIMAGQFGYHRTNPVSLDLVILRVDPSANHAPEPDRRIDRVR